MAEDDGDAPIRWDAGARGGAGGWVTAAGDTARAGPPGGAGPGNGGGYSVPPRVVLIAVGGAVLLAAAAVLVVRLFFSGSTDHPGQADAAPGGYASASSPARSAPAPPTGGQPQAPASAGTAGAQAAALDALLTRSAADREKVTAAVNAVDSCASRASVASAAEALNAASVRRDGLVTDLSRTALDALPDAGSAAADLRAAWRHSADADRAFAVWAADAVGCSPGEVPHGSVFARASESSELATAAKKEFLRKWAPIATRYGLPARDDTRI
ncbi:hypothetical protein AF335_20365 [Streptomyces eurocidicus]|uniref:Uncharacterized protein n=1 Tax=Streptomyces eurocidicus TaxID=66423 RepID=A0A2N8NTJ6_STREU|nr:hypothetical protein [Streptomyces eurocidicus]MBB5122927.1 hypothetical protein [Streptomyces eurocidicus]MBF6056510.1 hypothetical protein [Streptomyces eurocidicus]PNE32099.1 hypothetical protein AF335_20365 [Streptomyces eurocidicus]